MRVGYKLQDLGIWVHLFLLDVIHDKAIGGERGGALHKLACGLKVVGCKGWGLGFRE